MRDILSRENRCPCNEAMHDALTKSKHESEVLRERKKKLESEENHFRASPECVYYPFINYFNQTGGRHEASII